MSLRPELSSPHLVGDDPESLKQIRRLIVVLAISGRLSVSAEAGVDGHAIATRIELAKQRLVSQGLLGRADATVIIARTELPDALPASADYVRLGSVAAIVKGLTGIQKAAPGPFPLVVTAQDRAACDHFDFEGAAAIVPLVSSTGHGKASLQRLHYQEGKFALGSILAAVCPLVSELVSARFLYEYLTAFKDELLVSRMIGTANVSLSIGKISNVPVPLLTPAVQRRVDDLMALCDRLEVARSEREAARDRLAAASLALLNSPDPASFADDARVAMDSLPAIAARPDQISEIRNVILNLAMQGKLVGQEVTDEPAIDQLKRISESKNATCRRAYKHSGFAAPTNERTEDKELPPGWEWTSLGELLLDLRYGTSKRCSYGPGGTPVLRIPNVSGGQVSLDDMKFGPLTEAEQADLGLKRGDLLIIRSNGSLNIVGRAAEVGPSAEGMSFAGYLVRVRLSVDNVLPRFVWLALNTNQVRAQIEGPIRSAVGLKNVNSSEIAALSFALPPLAEQHRIVSKVNELMAHCDMLQASLTASAEYRSKSLEALLYQALEPSSAADLSASEVEAITS